MLVWVAHHGRWTGESWHLPTEYSGDSPEILARIQAASEGNTWPMKPQVIERLGAPFGAHWSGYPTPDKLLMLLLGGLTHLVGLFAAANLGLLLAQVSAALSFYFVARWLRCRWEWACAGALLFAYTYHTFHRGLGHFSLVFTWTVPLGLLTVWLVARSRRLEWRSTAAVVCFGSALGLGVGNPYNLYFWLQLMGWALVAQWFDRRRRANLAIGLATIGLALLAFGVSNFEFWFHVHEPEGAPLLARNYSGTEFYALKPIEMFIPPTYHRWDAFAFFGHRYVRWSVWRGEGFLPYLGIVGLFGLVWLVGISIRRLFTRRPVPGQILTLGWLVTFATVGGLANVVSLLAGFHLFRATNRVAIFISALVLFFLIVRLSRLTARWSPWQRAAAAMGLAALGLLDQVPKEMSPPARAEIAATVQSDRNFGRALEEALPPGTKVFQLPVQGFPEVTPPHRLADYEHFRPYLVTRTLNFSYGAPKFRAQSRWQRDLENAPTAQLVRRLESYGFGALYLNRKGYEDRAESLLRDLTALGYERRIESGRGQQVVVRLNPKSPPVLPLGREFTFGRGWHPRDKEGVRWAYEDAVMSYYNPYAHPLVMSLSLELVGVSEGELSFEHERRKVGEIRLGESPGAAVRRPGAKGGRRPPPARLEDQPAAIVIPHLELAPGVNRFVLRSSEAAQRGGVGPYQLRAFGLRKSTIKVRAGPEAVE